MLQHACIDRQTLVRVYLYKIIQVPSHITALRLGDQGAHVRGRLTANRFDLTLQDGPNQHGTQKPGRTTRTNFSPPRLELQNRPTCI